MSGIFALDLASRTGWAVARPGRRHLSGVHRVAPAGSGLPYFFSAFHSWLDQQLTVHQPAAVFFEAPLVRSGGGSFGKNNAEIAFGLVAITQALAHNHSARRIDGINFQTIKIFATGRGNASKDDMVDAARRRGYDPQDHNEADALSLLDYAIVKLAPTGERARAHFLGLDLPLLSGASA